MTWGSDTMDRVNVGGATQEVKPHTHLNHDTHNI